MTSDSPKPVKCPLLEMIMAHKNLPLRALYRLRDAADVFGVSVRSIQSRVRRGELIARNLPGRAKFLPIDLEDFLANSAKRVAIPS